VWGCKAPIAFLTVKKGAEFYVLSSQQRFNIGFFTHQESLHYNLYRNFTLFPCLSLDIITMGSSRKSFNYKRMCSFKEIKRPLKRLSFLTPGLEDKQKINIQNVVLGEGTY
jgi:hypothetical protein